MNVLGASAERSRIIHSELHTTGDLLPLIAEVGEKRLDSDPVDLPRFIFCPRPFHIQMKRFA